MEKRVLGVLCIGLLFISSCATIALDSTSLHEAASVNDTEDQAYTVLKSFSVNDKAGWALGIIPANKPAGDKHDYFRDILEKQIIDAGGDAIINLRIRAQNNFGDILISLFTWGLYVTRTVTVTGDVIKYN
ncbi:MAG: hypothetical protein IIA17_11940 [candidate division Zixibacteria bacterium]|nr:hypothetical protein [candidate division Zixibacteria bacterium]